MCSFLRCQYPEHGCAMPLLKVDRAACRRKGYPLAQIGCRCFQFVCKTQRDGNGGIEGNGGPLPPIPPTEFICVCVCNSK